MNLLYLIDKKIYDTKMSRVRFHGITALSKICNVVYSGPNWDNYNNDLTVQENIDNIGNFNAVIVFKPLTMKKFNEVKIPKIIRYNEMYNINDTINEIIESNADIVVCHHENDYFEYIKYQKQGYPWIPEHIKFLSVSHCAEKTIFKSYNIDKRFDVLLVGAISVVNSIGTKHYPLRERMTTLLYKMPRKYKCGILPHPQYDKNNAWDNKTLIDFAKTINSAKICVTCSGIPKSRFGKYIEIPACGTAMAADIPNEDKAEFKKFIIEIDMDMSDDEIINKLCYYLDNDNERKYIIDKGLNYAANNTQKLYAERLLNQLDVLFNVNIEKEKKDCY